MHREATDRNITPTTKQQLGAGSGTIPALDEDEDEDMEELDEETDITPVRTEMTMDVDPGGPTTRWTTFEDTLRRRREEVLQSSIDNVKRASGEKPAERARRRAS